MVGYEWPTGHKRSTIKMIHKFSITGAAALAVFVQGAAAADFVDVAPVVASTPIYEHVNAPRQECWNEQVTTQAPSNSGSPLGAIVGGIAGGVIGHQIGNGRGNAVATGIGAVTGAVIGDKVDPNGGVFNGNASAGTREQVVQRCRTVDSWQDVVRGYNVTYHYNGRDVTVRLPYDPGPDVRVSVSVITDRRPPVSYNGPQYNVPANAPPNPAPY
jgi:uncharacterized protein YcfJ